jgi:SAM-dependent methyltransferase
MIRVLPILGVLVFALFLIFSSRSGPSAPSAAAHSSASILRRAMGRPAAAAAAVVAAAPWPPPDAASFARRARHVASAVVGGAAASAAAPPPRGGAPLWLPPELLSPPPPPRVPPARGAQRAVGLDRSTLQGGDSGDAPEVVNFPAIKLDRNDGAWLNLEATNPAPDAGLAPPPHMAPLALLSYPPGLPTVAAYNRAAKGAVFKAMETYSDAFLSVNAKLVAEYGWSRDPLHAWSRRYEYVWAAEAVRAALPPAIVEALEGTWPAAPAAAGAASGFTVVDAASGFTFFAQFLASRLGCRVVALDHDATFGKLFKSAAPAPIAGEAPASVTFQSAKVEASGIPANSVDVVAYVGALENEANVEPVFREFLRILKPGGRLLFTFNVGMPPLARDKKSTAEALEVARRFFQEDISHGASQELRAARVVFTNRRVRAPLPPPPTPPHSFPLS